MKLSAKIFLCAMVVLGAAVLFSGYLLLQGAFDGALERETERALNQYQYNKFSVQSRLISQSRPMDKIFQADTKATGDTALFSTLAPELVGETAFFSENKTLLYTTLPVDVDASLLDGASDTAVVHRYFSAGGKTYLIVAGRLSQNGTALYLLTATDLASILRQRDAMLHSFQNVYFITMALGTLFVVLLSTLLTRPIRGLSRAAARIAGGHYDERLTVSGSDELSELAGNFNTMSEAIEAKVHELSENARQKEDFVASFAHELKTPMTSVIGYADMLYQNTLPPEEVKSAAAYILDEGLRLEALSLKLMDLIMLNRQSFILEEMDASQLLHNILDSLKPLMDEKHVTAHYSVAPVSVRVEYDLFKTLLLNLIDNAIKAGCTDLWLSGSLEEGTYHVKLTDNGRGIPEDQLDRITEAFYMVDKSRSRRQHGVGLGLALAREIARIHGTTLTYHSEAGKYTTVEFDLMTAREEDDYE